jgi:metal-sulfur cluster biosynthetic enzyme
MSATASHDRRPEHVEGHDDAPASAAGALHARVLDALSEVHDPELDEPITRLRFVTSVDVRAGGDGYDVDVLLRLPTPQCAPNFAFLMGADARRVVRAVGGVNTVTVRFEDHYTGDEINLALGGGAGFTAAFPGETEDDDLEALRALFTRKALIGRQATVCESMLGEGASEASILAATVAELPDLPETRRAIELRAQLGIPVGPEDPAFVTPGGEPIGQEGLRRWLRGAQLVRLSLEANGGMCRDLLRVRHGLEADPEEERAR